jgi:polyphosphate glucokinase
MPTRLPRLPRLLARDILVVDVGGTNIKVLAVGRPVPRKIPSGPSYTPRALVVDVKRVTAGWRYAAISVGIPCVVAKGRVVAEPPNLGREWVGFDFEKAFGRPVRITNDAAMQALGAYAGGRMLFLGLGTGLGSALVVDGVVAPLELGHLPYRHGRTFEGYVGAAGLRRLGRRRWRNHVAEVITLLRGAMEPEYVMLGGGNAHLVKLGPPDVQLIGERAALIGGCRLWIPPKLGPLRT